MFIRECWRGDRALVWRTTPPTPAPPHTLWTSDTPPPHPSDGPVWAPEFTIHQLLPPRTGEDAVFKLADYRRRITGTPPGGAMASFLQHRPDRPTQDLDVPGEAPLWANVLVDSIAAREKLIAHLHARQLSDLAELSANYPGIHEFLTTEIALALGVSEGTATARLAEADHLTTRLPATHAALHAGRITPSKARTIHQHTADVTPEIAHQVEHDVLPDAPTSTIPQLRDLVAAAVIRRDPHGADQRHENAKARRHLRSRTEPDGMGTLKVFSTMQDIATIHTALTAVGDAAKTPDDDRCTDHRRVDALVDLCADILDTGSWHGQTLPTGQRRRPHVQVTLPLTALLEGEPTGEVAQLTGYGPITANQARQIAADATLRRLVCDPLSGTLLDYGRTTYEPPAALADHVLARDLTCVMPGCRQPAWRSELDHIDPFRPGQPVGGPTSDVNLGPACKHHHRAKDGGEFVLTRTPDGYRWTTPLGRNYTRPNTRLWQPTPENTPAPTPPTDPDPPPF
jgi:hypothetical protein